MGFRQSMEFWLRGRHPRPRRHRRRRCFITAQVPDDASSLGFCF